MGLRDDNACTWVRISMRHTFALSVRVLVERVLKRTEQAEARAAKKGRGFTGCIVCNWRNVIRARWADQRVGCGLWPWERQVVVVHNASYQARAGCVPAVSCNTSALTKGAPAALIRNCAGDQ